jgi:ABC-type phosphate/phosphonate transport system permease subunit
MPGDYPRLSGARGAFVPRNPFRPRARRTRMTFARFVPMLVLALLVVLLVAACGKGGGY